MFTHTHQHEETTVEDVKVYLESTLDSYNAVVRAVNEWTYNRLLHHRRRSDVVSILTQKCNEYNLVTPPVWRDMLARPEYFDQLAQEDLGLPPEALSCESVDIHPH